MHTFIGREGLRGESRPYTVRSLKNVILGQVKDKVSYHRVEYISGFRTIQMF